MLILGIETSCDETAVGIVRDGRQLLANAIASQVPIHAEHGGVVPELASRQHIRDMQPTLQRALSNAGVTLEDIDAVAVTHGPGLAGALISGVNTGQSPVHDAGRAPGGRQPPGGSRLCRVAGRVRPGAGRGTGVSAGLPGCLRGAHRPHPDGRTRGLSFGRPHPGRRRRRGF